LDAGPILGSNAAKAARNPVPAARSQRGEGIMNGQTAHQWLDSFIHAVAVLGHGLAGIGAEDARAARLEKRHARRI
jgi:hypothetical protein